VIKIDKLSFSYKKSEKIIDNLSFAIPKNSIYGFLGSNGSGKTTTIRLILSLCKPDSGKILFQGKKLTHKLYENIGALIESPSFYNQLTAKENLKLLANFYNIKKTRIAEVIQIVGLENTNSKKVGQFSLGMKQKLGIAQSILHDPELLILDEPLNGLDPKGINEIRNLLFELKDQGKTILVSSHILDEVEKTCENVCVIDKGKKLFEGKIKELHNQVSTSNHFQVECERPQKAKSILAEKLNISCEIINSSQLLFQITDEKIIPLCIKTLVDNDIDIYTVTRVKHSLENLFLKLTQSNGN